MFKKRWKSLILINTERWQTLIFNNLCYMLFVKFSENNMRFRYHYINRFNIKKYLLLLLCLASIYAFLLLTFFYIVAAYTDSNRSL